MRRHASNVSLTVRDTPPIQVPFPCRQQVPQYAGKRVLRPHRVAVSMHMMSCIMKYGEYLHITSDVCFEVLTLTQHM